MKVRIATLLVFSSWAMAAHADALSMDLGTAAQFAVLAGSTVTNTGVTTIGGDLGVWPGSAITGLPPGIVTNGSTYAGDAVAMGAQSDLTSAYNVAAGAACGTNLSGQDLGGMTLTPGTYCFSSSAQLTGALTLNSEGDPNAVFLFQVASALTTASGSSVLFSNGGLGNEVFWQVGSSATLGTTTAFAGNILALESITLDTGATIGCGRALARNGAVTMDSNVVSAGAEGCGTDTSEPPPTNPVPEPGSLALLSTGLLGLGSWAKRWRGRAAWRVCGRRSGWVRKA